MLVKVLLVINAIKFYRPTYQFLSLIKANLLSSQDIKFIL